MQVSTMEGNPGRTHPLRSGQGIGVICLIVFGAVWLARPGPVFAECGEGAGPWSGPCVDLEWRPAQQTVALGQEVELGLYAVSVNALTQPIHAISVVLDWDPLVLEILPNHDPCNDPGSCFECPPEDPPSVPATYNWVASCYPNDSDLDDLNAGCGAGGCCGPLGFPPTTAPTNDGDALYNAIKQVRCPDGTAAPVAPGTPDGLLVTKIRFRALEGGTHFVDMADYAECRPHAQVCEYEGYCCNPPTCDVCSFARTRVIGGSYGGDVTTGTIGPPAAIEVLPCGPPEVVAEGSRYVAVIPAEGPDSVAIRVSGTSTPVECVDGYVQADGRVLEPGAGQEVEDNAVYRAPGVNGWATVHVRGERLTGAPNNQGTFVYAVQTDCDPDSPGTSLSEPVEVTLWRYGDVGGTYGPDGVVDFVDITMIVDGFRNVWGTPACCTTDPDCSVFGPLSLCNTDWEGCPPTYPGRCQSSYVNVDLTTAPPSCRPDTIIDFIDITADVDAFRNVPIACTEVCP